MGSDTEYKTAFYSVPSPAKSRVGQGFTLLCEHSTFRIPLLLSGSTLVVAHHESCVIHLMNIECGTIEYELHAPVTDHDPASILEV